MFQRIFNSIDAIKCFILVLIQWKKNDDECNNRRVEKTKTFKATIRVHQRTKKGEKKEPKENSDDCLSTYQVTLCLINGLILHIAIPVMLKVMLAL